MHLNRIVTKEGEIFNIHIDFPDRRGLFNLKIVYDEELVEFLSERHRSFSNIHGELVASIDLSFRALKPIPYHKRSVIEVFNPSSPGDMTSHYFWLVILPAFKYSTSQST